MTLQKDKSSNWHSLTSCGVSNGCTLTIYGIVHLLLVFITFLQIVESYWGLYPTTKETSADMACKAKGQRRRSTCPQLHPSLSRPARPMTRGAVSQPPWALCFPPLSPSLVLTWPGCCYTKVQSVIKTQGHQGPQGAGEVEAVPSRGWPHQCCHLPVAPLWGCIVSQKKGGERPSSAGTSFPEWWHFFCAVCDRPRPDSCTEAVEGVGRQWRPLHPRWELERLSVSCPQ